jgi:multicomponent Na+:H+ antiporter subunit E
MRRVNGPSNFRFEGALTLHPGQPDKRSLPTGFLGLWLLLAFIWVAANSSFVIESIATGVVLAGVLAFIFSRAGGVWSDLRISPARLYHFIRYTGVFAVELVRANLNMMRYVYAPRIDIKPGIVRVKVALKSSIGRLALANSIALTPGSLVIDIDGDAMFVHWLNVQTTDEEEATRIIAGRFAKHLEKTFD